MLRVFLLSLATAAAISNFGRKVVDITNFPYQVSLLLQNEVICGGAILDKWTVITSAHCVDTLKPEELQVRAGSNSGVEGGIIVNVTRIEKHDQYNNGTLDKDIAILRVETPFMFSSNIKPVNLPRAETENISGRSVVVSGWGTFETETNETSQQLRKADLEILEQDNCTEIYKKINATITESMLCASGSSDACKGDGGGPLVENNVLLGLVSWGNGCSNPEYPGVYTNVKQMINWIETKLQDYVIDAPPPILAAGVAVRGDGRNGAAECSVIHAHLVLIVAIAITKKHLSSQI